MEIGRQPPESGGQKEKTMNKVRRISPETGTEEIIEVDNPIVVVASSRSGATEVYRWPDGRLAEVQHLKSGRDVVNNVSAIPGYLTVRYQAPYPWATEIRDKVIR